MIDHGRIHAGLSRDRPDCCGVIALAAELFAGRAKDGVAAAHLSRATAPAHAGFRVMGAFLRAKSGACSGRGPKAIMSAGSFPNHGTWRAMKTNGLGEP